MKKYNDLFDDYDTTPSPKLKRLVWTYIFIIDAVIFSIIGIGMYNHLS